MRKFFRRLGPEALLLIVVGLPCLVFTLRVELPLVLRCHANYLCLP